MTTQTRVAKDWQQKGLAAYDTAAILGTLGHYGVKVDEAGFKQLAATQYPLGIAMDWTQDWEGKGQFTRFPYAAATELWRRLETGRATPEVLADAVSDLVSGLGALILKKQSDVDPIWKRVDDARKTAPLKDGRLDENFGAEIFQLLDARGEKFVQVFDALAEELIGVDQPAHADRFADLEEFLLPDREGVVKAIVRAKKGERDEAVKDIQALFAKGDRTHGATLIGIDGLGHLKAHEEAQALAEKLLVEAETKEDFHLGLELCERLAAIYEWTQNVEAMRTLEDRAKKLAAAHEKAHPHHAHHHHHH